MSRPRRILRVITSLDHKQGGPAQGLRTSVVALGSIDQRVDTEVVSLDPIDADYLADVDCVVHALGAPSGPWHRNPALGRWLLENLCRFDAVVVHGLWEYQGYAVHKAMHRLRASSGDVPLPAVYLMPHGMLDPWFQNDPSRRTRAIRNWWYWKMIESRNVALASGLLFTCQRELELARTTFRPYRPRREENIGYGVSRPPAHDRSLTEAFSATVPRLGSRPYLLYLSRIHPKKGVDLLIDGYVETVVARNRLGLDTPDLVIAGTGDASYLERMQTLATKRMRELPRRESGSETPVIHFPGMLTGDSKWGAFYGCEAFVLPSHQENFGIAVVEAMACGRPVLISDQVNICDEIAAAGAGLVDSDSTPGVTGLLSKFLGLSDDAKCSMGASALDCYRAKYDPEAAAKRLVKVLTGDGPATVPPSPEAMVP